MRARVGVRRQQLAVGVDVDAQPGALFEHLLQVAQVVAADQDRLAGARGGAHLGRFRVAVAAGGCGVQLLHYLVVQGADFQCPAQQIVHAGRVFSQEVQQAVELRIDGRVVLIQHMGVLEVRRRALDAVQHQRAQADHVGTKAVQVHRDGAFRGLFQQLVHGLAGVAGGRAGE